MADTVVSKATALKSVKVRLLPSALESIMSHWHCTKCHHEWDGPKDKSTCNWCGADGSVLEEYTPFEMMMRELPDLMSELFGILDTEK